jgi:soluble lytic murein transglycosylase-like protein
MTTMILMFASITNALNLPEGLLSSLCYVESKHNANIVHYNDKGSDSLGICQIKYTTAKELGYKGTPDKLVKDPKTNAFYAGKYLNKQLNKYNNYSCAIAAYNAGKCRLNKNGQIKNKVYVDKVLNTWGRK